MTGAASRRLSVCADDFGLSTGTSRCIAELAARGRITAISCLTTGRDWLHSAPLLADLPDTVERGLHFGLTEGDPASAALREEWSQAPALAALIAAAHIGALPRRAIGSEWAAQWALFVEATGRPPDFVDGHQHVHHLPGVREAMMDLLGHGSGTVAVRNTGRVIGPGHALKRWLIECTGGRALQRLLVARSVPHNAALLGVYDFRDPDYRGCMQRWIAAVPAEGALLFCHPGAADAASTDPIAVAREREAAYLGSQDFADDLQAAGVTLGSVWQRRSSSG